MAFCLCAVNGRFDLQDDIEIQQKRKEKVGRKEFTGKREQGRTQAKLRNQKVS